MTALNKAGRPIWFVPSRDGGGTVSPVTPQGRWAFVLAAAWILGCGTIFPILMVLTFDWRWLLAMFAAGAAGLAAFATAVIRHS